MKKQIKDFFSPALRLNLIVICGIVLLLSVSLGVMFYFSHEVLHREARLDAEQTLEGAVQHIDNILLGIEQSAGNVYTEMVSNLDKPERMADYCRRLVESSPFIGGSAICLKPNYYPDRELFMAYVHRKGGGVGSNGSSELITSDRFGTKPYTEHQWYTLPMTTGRAVWTNPLPEEEDEGVTLSFCLPIYDRSRELVGVLVADLSVDLLSKVVLTNNPSPNKYCVLLGSDGSLIVHPSKKKGTIMSVFKITDEDGSGTARKAAEAMLAGETGYMPFSLRGKDWYVFYKPFLQTEIPSRSMEKISWSIGVVYTEDEIFGSFNYLLMSAVLIAILGLLLFYIISRIVTRRQLKHLQQLTYATKRIAEGYYDEEIPEIKRHDEIGQLYEQFLLMKQSLSVHAAELEQLTGKLKNRREVMNEVYAEGESIDRVMTNFLHYVTNQMVAPADDIKNYVTSLCGNYRGFSPEEIDLVVHTINKKSEFIVDLINNMLNTADYDARMATAGKQTNEKKEVAHG